MVALKGRLLALSWAMPPLVYPRSLQVSRLLKTLNERGWQSTVVTLLPDADASALQDHALAGLYAGSYRLVPIDVREASSPSPLWLRIWRRLQRLDDITADNWVRRSFPVLRGELAGGGYQALVTFAQPWADHLVGLRVKRRFCSVPWVAHFSDPWVDSPYSQFKDPGEEARLRKQERAVIEAADAVIFVTQETADLVMAKYPNAWRSKVSIVGHGYDRDLMRLVSPREASVHKFRIVHTGSLYGKRGPHAVMSALAELAKDATLRSLLEVEFIGYMGPEWIETTKNHGLEDFVRFRGRSRYVESLAAASAADLLLLIDAPAKLNVFLPSKLVDYMMLGKPILGLTPGSGATADVLRSLGCTIVAPDDPRSIAAAVHAAFMRWRTGPTAAGLPDQEKVDAFDIRDAALGFESAIKRAISAAVPGIPDRLGPRSERSLDGTE